MSRKSNSEPMFRAQFTPGQAVNGRAGQVLLLSMRRVNTLVAHSMNYEFEDVIAEVTGADRIDVGDMHALEFSRRSYKTVRLLSGSARLAQTLSPAPSTVRLERDYELFFPVFNHPYELYALATIPEWRKRCRVAACFLNEAAFHMLPGYLLELLRDFDHVFLGVRQPAEAVARLIGRPCTYLGIATDVLKFAPSSDQSERPIDVCNIGRRSQVTHESFLKLARQRQLFYYYDTIAATGPGQKQRTFQVHDASEHRLMLAELLRRSRYYIANRSRINEPEFAYGADEISGRFYEGAAAGAVMLGEVPNAEHFRQQFDWPDAVIHLPFDSPDAVRLLADLDRDPKRLALARTQNVRNAALRHDWVHRFKTVLETLRVADTLQMRAREELLKKLAASTNPVLAPLSAVGTPR